MAALALLTDLDERGLLDETLVVLMGEMGRTPLINDRKRGRDHWPDVYSVLMALGAPVGRPEPPIAMAIGALITRRACKP